MAKNLNAPENCVDWLRACQRSEHPMVTTAPLAMLTGTDTRALVAIAAAWDAFGREGNGGAMVVAGLLDRLQPKCWPFARELAAQQMEWSDRDPLWARVMAHRNTPRVMWRGSARDFVTDLLPLLTAGQEQELVDELSKRRATGKVRAG